jgi:hypothetical protein
MEPASQPKPVMDVKAPAKPVAAQTSDQVKKPSTPDVALPLHKAPIEDEETHNSPPPAAEAEVPTASPPKPQGPKSSRGPAVAIILTLTAMVALSTLAIYMYTQS